MSVLVSCFLHFAVCPERLQLSVYALGLGCKIRLKFYPQVPPAAIVHFSTLATLLDHPSSSRAVTCQKLLLMRAPTNSIATRHVLLFQRVLYALLIYVFSYTFLMHFVAVESCRRARHSYPIALLLILC